MHETRCSGLVHWDDPEGLDGEGGSGWGTLVHPWLVSMRKSRTLQPRNFLNVLEAMCNSFQMRAFRFVEEPLSTIGESVVPNTTNLRARMPRFKSSSTSSSE